MCVTCVTPKTMSACESAVELRVLAEGEAGGCATLVGGDGDREVLLGDAHGSKRLPMWRRMWRSYVTCSVQNIARFSAWYAMCAVGAWYVLSVVIPNTDKSLITQAYDNCIATALALPAMYYVSARHTFVYPFQVMLWYCFSFVIGIQFGFFHYMKLFRGFLLTGRAVRGFTSEQVLVIAGIVAVNAAITVRYVVVGARRWLRALAICAAAASCGLVYWAGATSSPVHVHHYLVGLYIVTMTPLSSNPLLPCGSPEHAGCVRRHASTVVLAAVQGFGLGMFIDGAVEYGFEPFWDAPGDT